MNLAVLREVEDHGFHPPVNRGLPRQTELEEDRVNHLLDRTLGQEERLGDGRVVLPFGHLAQHVALAVELQQARNLVTADPAATGVLIDEMAGQLQEAADALRALAHRIHPPLLEAGGLRAALRTTAAMLGVPTRVRITAGATLPADIAGAVYFSCADALAQLGERAKVAITIRQEGENVVFEIVAEGSVSAAADADLIPMRDRLEALGGRLTIESEPGHSAITGSLPISG